MIEIISVILPWVKIMDKTKKYIFKWVNFQVNKNLNLTLRFLRKPGLELSPAMCPHWYLISDSKELNHIVQVSVAKMFLIFLTCE